MTRNLLLVLVILGTIFLSIDSKGMWGSRKKREESDEAPKPTIPEIRKPRDSRQSSPISKKSDLSSGIESLIDSYVQLMEDLIQSENFEKLVTPESVEAILEQIPGFGDNDELKSLFMSPEFKDPKQLKATMLQGLNMIRSYSREIVDTLADPEKLEELLGSLPPELRPIAEAVKSGNANELQSIIVSMMDALPGVDESQKDFIKSLLMGNTDNLTQNVRKILGDEQHLENVRQQLLASPAMAEAFGVPIEVLEDRNRWKELMAEGINQLDDIDRSEKKAFFPARAA